MDNFNDAMRDLNPRSDPDAAVTLALGSILMNSRLHELACLLIDGHDIGGIEGEPGWIIERRDTGPTGNLPYYSKWPINARFRVHVEPAAFELPDPEIFMKAHDFYLHVERSLDLYPIENSTEKNAAQFIRSHLKSIKSV